VDETTALPRLRWLPHPANALAPRDGEAPVICQAPPMTTAVRRASPEELVSLEAVERLAATRFDDEVVTAALEKNTVPLRQLQVAHAAGLVWVAVAEDRAIVGFLMAEPMGERLHITEIGVIPARGRQGIGGLLLAAVRLHAQEANYSGVSLTTFATVPWNAPFFAKHGFRPLQESELGALLSARMAQERSLGLVDRIAMCSGSGTYHAVEACAHEC
jgi:N-acetylglutamate synthase-like GNAT family acetyltransferase